jgi:hypothetical protein
MEPTQMRAPAAKRVERSIDRKPSSIFGFKLDVAASSLGPRNAISITEDEI